MDETHVTKGISRASHLLLIAMLLLGLGLGAMPRPAGGPSPASGQAPIIQGRLYLLNNGTRGIYFLSGYTPMKDVTIEITVDELIPSNDTNSQQRMDVIQLEYPSSIKTNINGEARFNLGATLLTHPSNQYPAATYTANVLIATHCDSCN